MSSEANLKHVPLESRHIENGARMVPFAGFSMPLQYTSITEEHAAVRERAGLFDVSHMGEIEVRGEAAIAEVNRIVTNDVSKLADGQALYTVMCHPSGGIVDDLLVYRLASDHLLLCVNAANRDKDREHILAHATGACEIEDTGDQWAQLALQGPRAFDVLDRITVGSPRELGSFFGDFMEIAGVRCLVSRTGYTGEDGVELYIPAAYAGLVFDVIFEEGKSHGLALCGLGCRDTLRLEAKLHLYGQDMDDETDPFEAGLSWTVKLNKEGDFVGKDALLAAKERGVTRRLRGLVVEDKGVIRPGYEVYHGDQKVGEVTSGSYSPTLETSIGLAYIDAEVLRGLGDEDRVEVAVRKRRLSAKLTKKPFYTRG